PAATRSTTARDACTRRRAAAPKTTRSPRAATARGWSIGRDAPSRSIMVVRPSPFAVRRSVFVFDLATGPRRILAPPDETRTANDERRTANDERHHTHL